jgi:3-dehydroquinate dehydratase type II
MRNVVVINGPNLNLLGTREPDVYGSTTLSQLEAIVKKWGTENAVVVETFQSNHEGQLIDRLHQAATNADGVVINPGALTHYSYALHDAIAAISVPTVEVHISNVLEREEWRSISVVRPACVYSIFGRGIRGYLDALSHLEWRTKSPALTLSYGSSIENTADLRVPSGHGPHPVAIVLHGGLWRDIWSRDLTDGVAVDLTARGWATWNVEYRRLGVGGGWPTTLDDVCAAIDAVADLATEHSLDVANVVTVGHSSGGYLALAAAARSRPSASGESKAERVKIGGVIAVAPIADLKAAHNRGMAAVSKFLAPDGSTRGHYGDASPAAMLPLGVPQVIIHGSADDLVGADLSASYAAAALEAGDDVVYHEPVGVGHYDLFDPSSETRRIVATELERLRSRR